MSSPPKIKKILRIFPLKPDEKWATIVTRSFIYKGLVCVKKALIFLAAAALMLTSCKKRADIMLRETTAFENIYENAETIDWDKVLPPQNELDNAVLLGGSDEVFCGYDRSVMAGDGGNLTHYDPNGTAIENMPVYGSRDLIGTVRGAGCFDGVLYELATDASAEGKLLLLSVKDGLIFIEGELSCDLNDSNISLITDGGVIVSRKKTEYDGDVKRTEYTAWLFEDGEFRKVLYEVSKDDPSQSESEGLEIIDCGIEDGMLKAYGVGRRDGKYDCRICEYTPGGELKSSEIICSVDGDAIGSCVIPMASAEFFAGTDEGYNPVTIFCFDENYSLAVNPHGRVVIFERESGKAVSLEAVHDETFHLTNVISVGCGFIGEFMDDDEENIRHTPVIYDEDIALLFDESTQKDALSAIFGD